MTAKYYPEDIKQYNLSNNDINVQVFICDETTTKAQKCAKLVKDGSIITSKNYLQTIINGAKELKLNEFYINRLEKYQYMKLIKFNPSDEQWKIINSKTFKMETDIKHRNNELCVCKGIVFNTSQSLAVFVHLQLERILHLMYWPKDGRFLLCITKI
eukprot:510088_1